MRSLQLVIEAGFSCLRRTVAFTTESPMHCEQAAVELLPGQEELRLRIHASQGDFRLIDRRVVYATIALRQPITK
jgi:hypothetical protein